MSRLRIFDLELQELTTTINLRSSKRVGDRSNALAQLLLLSSQCSFLLNFISERLKRKPLTLQPPEPNNINDDLHVLYHFASIIYETWPSIHPSLEFACSLRVELIKFFKVYG